MFVYILKAERFMKIGFTGLSLEARIKQLQTGCPFDIELYFYQRMFSSNQAKRLEAWVHNKYAKYNKRGEWFIIPKNKLNNIIFYLKAFSNANVFEHYSYMNKLISVVNTDIKRVNRNISNNKKLIHNQKQKTELDKKLKELLKERQDYLISSVDIADIM